MPSKAKGLHHPGRPCRNSMPGRRPGIWQHSKQGRRLGIWQQSIPGRQGNSGYGVGVPGIWQKSRQRRRGGVRRPTPDATRLPFQAFRALCVSALAPSLPRPGRKELAEFQFSLEAMGLQREADAELPSAPLEAVGVGRRIGGIEFPVILPLFDQSP